VRTGVFGSTAFLPGTDSGGIAPGRDTQSFCIAFPTNAAPHFDLCIAIVERFSALRENLKIKG